jgi:excisionase family DNA binding protein
MDALLTPEEAANHLGVSINTLACWRTTMRYPLAWVRIGNRVRYREADLERFIESRAQNTSSKAA